MTTSMLEWPHTVFTLQGKSTQPLPHKPSWARKYKVLGARENGKATRSPMQIPTLRLQWHSTPFWQKINPWKGMQTLSIQLSFSWRYMFCQWLCVFHWDASQERSQHFVTQSIDLQVQIYQTKSSKCYTGFWVGLSPHSKY